MSGAEQACRNFSRGICEWKNGSLCVQRMLKTERIKMDVRDKNEKSITGSVEW